MRILVVASTFPAHDSDPVPAFVKDQIIALHQAYPALEFSVLAPHDRRSRTQAFSQHEHYGEYRFHYFWPFAAEKLAGRGIMPALKANPLNYLLIPFLFAGEFFALLRLTRRLKPAVIYAHWFTPQVVTAHLVGALTRTPFVFTTHSSDVAVWHKIPLLGPHIVRSNTKQARAVTAVSRRSLAKLESFFPPELWAKLQPRTRIIPMGVTLPDVSQAAQASKTILFVGRLAEKKGVQYLLPAFAAVRDQLLDYTLVVAGDGPWRQQLERQARDLGLDNRVSFPGYVSGEAKARLVASAELFVVPSIIAKSGDAEGLPVSLMEGLASGKLCIATNESGADDVLTDGQDGWLIKQKDVNGLAAALVKAAGLDAHKRQAVAKRARATARQFAWPAVAKQHYEFLFKDLV